MEFRFRHPKTFRSEILQTGDAPNCILYALHGYGQLARYFVQKFNHLPENILIIAPEGMHRFYLNGHSGRVGASWMTKEAREQDIEDNMEWLSALDKQVSKEYSIQRRILLGFSQGGATAIRWAARNPSNFESLIVWGSDFPPDASASSTEFENLRRHFVLGEADEFIQGDRKNELVSLYEKLNFRIHSYPGTHDIAQDLLFSLIQQELRVNG